MRKECEYCDKRFKTETGYDWYLNHVHGITESEDGIDITLQSLLGEEVRSLKEDSQYQRHQLFDQNQRLSEADALISDLRNRLDEEGARVESLGSKVEELQVQLSGCLSILEEQSRDQEQENEGMFPIRFYR